MANKSLTPKEMETRVARFNKLESYQKQNFDKHNIPPGAVEKVTARRVYPVMARVLSGHALDSITHTAPCAPPSKLTHVPPSERHPHEPIPRR